MNRLRAFKRRLAASCREREDFGGNSGEREYDYITGQGDLVRIVYPDQSYELFENDPDVHRPTAHRDRGGDWTYFTYDSDTGDLLTVTDPAGTITTYVWDDGLLLSSSRNGKTTTFTYDAARRLIEIENPLGATSGFSYDSAGNPLTRADFNGHVSTTVYDERNQLVERHGPAGGVVSFEYRAAGMLDQTSNARGFVSVNDWDQRGFLVSVTRAYGEPEASATEFTYDLDGSRITQTDALGRVSTFVYDSLHRRTETIDALGNVTTVVYDASNNVKNAIDALGRVTTFTYDTDNRLVTTTDPLGRVTTNVYDAEGLLLARIKPVNRQTAYAYDAADRPYRVTDAENQVTTTVYNADGLVSATTGKYLVAADSASAQGISKYLRERLGITADTKALSSGRLFVHIPPSQRPKLSALPSSNMIAQGASSLYANAIVSDSGNWLSWTQETADRLRLFGEPKPDGDREKLEIKEMLEMLGHVSRFPVEHPQDVKDRMLSMAVLRGEALDYSADVKALIQDVRRRTPEDLTQHLLMGGRLVHREQAANWLEKSLVPLPEMIAALTA